jgi:hypothetical protein
MEKTLAIHDAELREQIAKEIEDSGYVWLGGEDKGIIVRSILAQAAAVVRSKI